MSEISFSGQWDERTSTALVAFHYVARRTNTDDRLEGSSVGLFQARCLSGRGKSRTRGILGGALCCADTKTRGPPLQFFLRRAKWPRFSALALQLRAQPERVASPRLNTTGPLCSSFVYFGLATPSRWQLTNTPSSNEFQKVPLSITCSTIRIAAANARGDGSLGTSFEAYFSRSQLNAQPNSPLTA